jgi:DNA-binding NarL/FixJ family response regulator
MPVKILMVDDHKIVREGLCALVNNEPDMEVIG